MTLGTLAVFRARHYMDSPRAYRIMVDGSEAGTIECGEELRFNLTPGDHEVVARLDWCRSKALPIGIRAGEVTELEVGNNLRGWRKLAIFYFFTFGYSDYLYLRHRVDAFPVVYREELGTGKSVEQGEECGAGLAI